MKPIENARQIAAQRVTPLQPIAPSGAVRAGDGNPAPTPAPANALAAIAAQVWAGGEAPIDAARVSAIRDAIGRGEYYLDPAAIADAMIAAGHVKRDSE